MEPDLSPAELVAQSDGLILDFDGPICDVYAGRDPGGIASSLAVEFGLVVETCDPLDLIRQAIQSGGQIDVIHSALAQAEVEAIDFATETPGARHLIERYEGPIAIASNNADQAIYRWLNIQQIAAHFAVVIGRDPRQMKPSPTPLRLCANKMRLATDRCVFVGDSVSDIEAAQLAGCPVISFANKPSKRKTFEEFAGVPVVDHLDQLI